MPFALFIFVKSLMVANGEYKNRWFFERKNYRTLINKNLKIMNTETKKTNHLFLYIVIKRLLFYPLLALLAFNLGISLAKVMIYLIELAGLDGLLIRFLEAIIFF